MIARAPWDTYFATIARMVASRSTCNRRQVGAVITRDNHILSTGYNGSYPGEPHCTAVGCLPDDRGHCTRTIHAEVNAISWAIAQGIKLAGTTIYTTVRPCSGCAMLIAYHDMHVEFIEDYQN
jgi:dCMP deaminase